MVTSLRRAWPLAMLLAALDARADTGTNELRVDRQFQVRAVITAGCLLGSGGSDVASYGNINFGPLGSLGSPVNRTSTPGSGSIVLQCTPGIALTIGIGAGANASSVTDGRFLAKGGELLRYQLYKDSAFSNVWGDGNNGATALSATFPSAGGTQSYPVYARLFSVTPMPSAGVYSDVVTVTVSY